jgi:hypothetical protein
MSQLLSVLVRSAIVSITVKVQELTHIRDLVLVLDQVRDLFKLVETFFGAMHYYMIYYINEMLV